MRRWLKWTLLALAAVLALLLVLVLWLGLTRSGLDFALGRTSALLQQKFTWERAEGSLLGGMRLYGVRYADPEIGDYRVAAIAVAPRSRRLLTGGLHLTGVDIQGVDLTLGPPVDRPASDEPFRMPELRAPLPIRVDRLQVVDFALHDHERTPLLVLDRIDGAAQWSGSRLQVQPLTLTGPDGQLQLQANLDTGADWVGDADAQFRWRLPGEADQDLWLGGAATLAGPLRDANLQLDLHEPGPAQVRLDLQLDGGQAGWQAQVRSDGFDLATVLAEPPVQQLVLDLESEGRADLDAVGGDVSGRLQGRIGLDGYDVLIEELAAALSQQVVTLTALALAEADGPGRLTASGLADLTGELPTGHLDAGWSDINPPLAAPFERLDSHGRIQAEGTLEAMSASIEAGATVDGQALQLMVQAHGDPAGDITLAPAQLLTGDGRLEATGSIRAQPAPAWDLELAARDFDPGLLLPDWPGQVELDASSSGELADGGLLATVEIEGIGGQLRQRPLAGNGRIEITGSDHIQSRLDLRLGDNRIELDGLAGAQYDARIEFDLAEPALFADAAAGRARGQLQVRGQSPDLIVSGQIEGSGLAWAEHRIARLVADIDADLGLARASRIDLRAEELILAGQTVNALDLNIGGTRQDSRLGLSLDAGQGQLVLEMAGQLDPDRPAWSGQVQALRMTSEQLPEALTLVEPAPLTLAADQVSLAATCLAADDIRLCLDADWAAGADGDAGFELQRLPLAWLYQLSGDDQFQISGELGGRGRFRLPADGPITGQAHIDATPGRIRFALGEDERDLLAWSRLATQVDLAADGGADIDAVLELSPAGQLLARISTTPVDGTSALAGEIDVDLPELGFLELLSPELVQPVGRLHGQLQLAGTLAAPEPAGELLLEGFGVELPTAGLRLRDSRLAMRSAAAGRIELDGRINTDEDSTLTVGGWLGPPGDGHLPMSLQIQGERVLVADIPAARVFVSPQLEITADQRRMSVNGQVGIPQAMIRPEHFPGGGAASASPDVHIVGAEETAAAEDTGLPLFADVQVNLGDRVQIEGYGLEGRLRGQLQIRERPARATSALGEISVVGTYQAYGQDLDIERGRLLFSGPVTNPNLDIRAVRRVQAVTAGLAVTGNVRQPVLEVYSVPAMDQAEALSYLVLGRPLRQATSSSDMDALGTAATAVTTAGGDLLAKSLGSRLGLDDVGVGTSRELGAGALTVGKYLSPRLYLGYGRSLFDGSQLVSLRYQLNERLELEVQSGAQDNKAGINYRYER